MQWCPWFPWPRIQLLKSMELGEGKKNLQKRQVVIFAQEIKSHNSNLPPPKRVEQKENLEPAPQETDHESVMVTSDKNDVSISKRTGHSEAGCNVVECCIARAARQQIRSQYSVLFRIDYLPALQKKWWLRRLVGTWSLTMLWARCQP